MGVPPITMGGNSRNQSCSTTKCMGTFICTFVLLGAVGFGIYVGFVDPDLINRLSGAEAKETLSPSGPPTTAAPTFVQCAAGCSAPMRGNNMCDAACFNTACDLDDGDCDTVETGTHFLRTIFLGNNTIIPANIEQAVNTAVNRWNAMITTQVTGSSTANMFKDIVISPAAPNDNRAIVLENCFPYQPDVENIALQTMRGLVVSLEFRNIDGVGGTLGQTAVCVFTRSTARAGLLTFDLADLESLAERNQLESVMLHELGHAIGLGTMWQDLYLRTAEGSGYNGTNALTAYKELDASFSAATEVPLETEGGAGTAFVHWENLESTGGLCDEVMTGSIKSSTEDAKLSAVSIQALRDLGHSIATTSEGTLPTLAELCQGVSANDDAVDLSGDVKPMETVALFDPDADTVVQVVGRANIRRLLVSNRVKTSKQQHREDEKIPSSSGLRGV